MGTPRALFQTLQSGISDLFGIWDLSFGIFGYDAPCADISHPKNTLIDK
jgi:hypothetical protein